MNVQVEGSRATDKQWFRQVLGQFPTGVCVVTATPPDGTAAGMVVGSFTSVSLDPPLVAFFPDKGSSSWPRIESAGKFCVNILGEDQEAVCRRFASKAPDKFEGQAHRPAGSGSPILQDVVAWIDCDIQSVQEAGDHYIVLGSVLDLQIESPRLPLLFFQGGYGAFAPLSLAAPNTRGALTEQLRSVDLIRPEMEHLAESLSARCIATTRVDRDLVVLASAGSPTRSSSTTTLVGQRLPFVPPTGSVFAAWMSTQEVEKWLSASPAPHLQDAYREALAAVRSRGFSVGLQGEGQRQFASALERLAAQPNAAADVDLRTFLADVRFDPPELTSEVLHAIRLISVPVFGPDGEVAFGLTLYEFPRPENGIRAHIDHVVDAGRRASNILKATASANG
jgi:flavin reductase (DIM6/NTAB) family NADH-FMN oxidoreductase RutF/DNA-binding IclR family transcriptional regulator